MDQMTPQYAQGGPANVPAGPARRNNKLIKAALVVAAVLAMCLMGLIPIALIAASSPAGFLVGLVLALLPVPVYLAFTLWIDRYEKEPIRMLAWAFLWGASVSIFFSLIISLIGSGLVSMFLGEGAADVAGTVIFAPVVEESMKALALFILFFWKKDEFDNVIDGIVYATMVGLGFTLVEDLMYHAQAFAAGGIGGSIGTFIVRGVLSPWGHPLYTSMVGIGLGLARQSSNTAVKFGAPAAGLMVAITLHAIWNGSSYVIPGLWTLVLGTFVFYPMILIPVLVIVFIFLRREGRIIRQYLVPELQSGLVTQQEYDSLGSVTGRMRSSFTALKGGFGSWRAYSRFSQTATELAFHRDRVARGITSVDTASREAAYVDLLRQLKGATVR
jgi:RsiW-degrading membrane proteinase PrsW (M82 family)